jgi:hypothetical protein
MKIGFVENVNVFQLTNTATKLYKKKIPTFINYLKIKRMNI